jgi:hypothetical protein
MTIFANREARLNGVAIDGTIEGDTLHVGCVMVGRLRPGDWLAGTGYEDFMIERQIASRPDQNGNLIPESLGDYMITFASEKMEMIDGHRMATD